MHFPRRTHFLRGLAGFVAGVALLAGITSGATPAVAGEIGTQTTIPGLVLTMSFEIPLSTTSAGLPTGTFVKSTLTVTNPAAVSFMNQPMVLRFGQKPDQILSVDDGTGKVGVIDPSTGAWYHTIAAIPATSSTTYTITYAKVCPGRWAFAARVGERTTSQFVQWAGPNDLRCVGDETTNPQPTAFYQLPWPSSIATAPTTTNSAPAPSSTTSVGSPASPVSSTTTTAASGAASSTTTTTTTTRPGGPTSSTLLSLDRPSTTAPTTTRTTTTTRPGSKATTGRTTTTILFCKTIGGNRYCGPKSSAYKPGQAKSIEVRPTTQPAKKKKRR